MSSLPSSIWSLPNSSRLVLQDVLWAGNFSLLLAPPNFSQFVFKSSTTFFIGTSCYETADANGFHCAWPKWAVSIHGSLNGISEWLILRIPSRIRWVTSSEGNLPDAVGHPHSAL